MVTVHGTVPNCAGEVLGAMPHLAQLSEGSQGSGHGGHGGHGGHMSRPPLLPGLSQGWVVPPAVKDPERLIMLFHSLYIGFNDGSYRICISYVYIFNYIYIYHITQLSTDKVPNCICIYNMHIYIDR